MITHLITNGCSYTYCQNLKDREVNGWPYQLARNLNIDVINLAVVGCGNDSITRRTYEYIFNPQDHIKPFYVIGWSQYWRREGWYNDLNDYDVVKRPKTIEDLQDPYKKIVIEHWNVKEHARKTLLLKAQLKTLFDHTNIPYIMIDMASPDDHYFKKIDQYNFYANLNDSGLDNSFNPMINFVYDKFHLSDVSLIRNGLEYLPCGHDDIEFQNRFSKFLCDKIKELYPNHLLS